MPSDKRSISFVFHRNVNHSDETVCGRPTHKSNLRRRLQDRFDEEVESCSDERNNRVVNTKKSWHNLSLDSKRMFRHSTEKISKTFSSVKVTLDTISQRLRKPTRRCHRLREQYSPCSTDTPQSHSRNLLGRTPTKLYSPFGIESPNTSRQKEEDIVSTDGVPKILCNEKVQRFLSFFREEHVLGLI